MRHRGNLLVATVLGILGFLSFAASSARADIITPLPITSFYQIVADTAHGHLFISQGSSSQNDILVTDLTGQEVTTIGGQDGVMGMALSPDGSTLYAALASGHEISAISTSTLQQTAVYPIGSGNTPSDVAVQSGKVWVSYGTGSVGQAAIGDIDLSATSPAFETQAAMDGWYAAPQLAADPQDTGVLVAAEPGLSPSSVASYNTSVDPATVRAQSVSFQNCDNEGDLSVAPGGAEFVLACGAPYAHYRYSTANLSQLGSYPSTNYPDAVAIAASGMVAAGTANNPSSQDVYVYKADSTTALNTYNVGGSSINLVARGLAWSATGSQLFAVIQDATAGYTLHVLYPPLTSSVLSLSGPQSVSLGTSVQITGQLALGNGTLPSGTTVAVTRTLAGGTGSTQFTVPVASNGSFTLSDKPTALGSYTYTASYSGSSSIPPASASYSLTVTKAASTLSLSAPSTVYAGKSVQITGRLTVGTGALPAGTAVTINRALSGSGSDAKQFTVTPEANGSFSLSDSLPALGTYTYSASYSGTADINPASASRTVTFTRMPTSLTMTTGATTFNYEPTVHVTVHLGTTYTNRTVSIYEQWMGFKGKTLLKTGRVNSRGELTISYAAQHSTTFSAVFAGDARYAPKTVTHGVSVRAKVSGSLSGYYGNKRIGSTTYWLYHHNNLLYAHATVTPNKRGQCVQFQVQEYYQGTWYANVTTGCISLNSSSKVTVAFNLTQADRGYHYRIREDYVRSGNDISNLSNDSGWQYFIVEN